MSQYLPTGNFRWMTDKEINKIDLVKYKTNGKKGLISEVDLDYPQKLHNLRNDYPVAPEKAIMLLRYCKKIAEKYKISTQQTNPNVKKQGKVHPTLSKPSAIP